MNKVSIGLLTSDQAEQLDLITKFRASTKYSLTLEEDSHTNEITLTSQSNASDKVTLYSNLNLLNLVNTRIVLNSLPINLLVLTDSYLKILDLDLLKWLDSVSVSKVLVLKSSTTDVNLKSLEDSCKSNNLFLTSVNLEDNVDITIDSILEFNSTPNSVVNPRRIRFAVQDVYPASTNGDSIVVGKVDLGEIKIGDKLKSYPKVTHGEVLGIQVETNEFLNHVTSDVATLNDKVGLRIADIDRKSVRRGSLLCLASNTSLTEVKEFKAVASILHHVNFDQLANLDFHNDHCTGKLELVQRVFNPNNGSGDDMALKKGEVVVLKVTPSKLIALDIYKVCRPLGRVAIRQSNHTIAVAVVTEIVGE